MILLTADVVGTVAIIAETGKSRLACGAGRSGSWPKGSMTCCATRSGLPELPAADGADRQGPGADARAASPRGHVQRTAVRHGVAPPVKERHLELMRIGMDPRQIVRKPRFHPDQRDQRTLEHARYVPHQIEAIHRPWPQILHQREGEYLTKPIASNFNFIEYRRYSLERKTSSEPEYRHATLHNLTCASQ